MIIDFSQPQPLFQRFRKFLIMRIAGRMPVMLNMKLSHGRKDVGLVLVRMNNCLFSEVTFHAGPTKTGFTLTGIDKVKELNQ